MNVNASSASAASGASGASGSARTLVPPGTPAAVPDPWTHLRHHTAARIALGRTGASLPTAEVLRFAHDHALARDAVQAPFDENALAATLRALPEAPEVLALTSAAPDRATYLRRPDLGRRLSHASAALLAARRPPASPHASRVPHAAHGSSPSPSHPHPPASASASAPCDLIVIVSDGLSALAASRQAPRVLAAFLPAWRAGGGSVGPVCVVRHARVGILDEIGVAGGASLALILLGERPGLGTADSLGAYFTFGPRPGNTDAHRNCVSNIRDAGLAPEAAAALLAAWLHDARVRRLSGVALKLPQHSPAPPALPTEGDTTHARLPAPGP